MEPEKSYLQGYNDALKTVGSLLAEAKKWRVAMCKEAEDRNDTVGVLMYAAMAKQAHELLENVDELIAEKKGKTNDR